MLLHTDLIDPAELTGYVREDLADREENRFTLAQFLPNRIIDDLQYRFMAGGEGLAEAATFRSYDAESPIGGRPDVVRQSGELPPISRKYRLGEYDRLRQRQSTEDAVRRAVLSDARRGVRAIAARLELARGQALLTGKVAITENGLTVEADFGRAGNHTTNAGTSWATVATANVLSDLILWRDRFRASTGEDPGVVLASTTVLRLMQRNAEVINAITGATAARTRVTRGELNALLESEGIPPVREYDVRVRVGGQAVSVLGENTVVMVPAAVGAFDFESSDLGGTFWGTTAEALDERFGIEEGEEPGIVAGVYSTDDPIALWTKSAAIGLPVLANPDLSLAATVVPA